MTRRTGLLIAAIVVALLGTLLVFLYVQSKSNEIAAENQPVRVLVATQQIATGTSGSAAATSGSFALQEVPSSAVVPGAVSDAASLAELTALTTIFPGQQIIAAQWGPSGSTNASKLPVPDGRIGISIQLGDPQRVAGFVAPGSKVTVFSTTPGTNGQNATRVLLPESTVIAVGPTTVISKQTSQAENTTTEQIPSAIMTLALTQKEAEKIIFASSNGQLYMGLLGKNTKVTVPDAGVSSNNLYVP